LVVRVHGPEVAVLVVFLRAEVSEASYPAGLWAAAGLRSVVESSRVVSAVWVACLLAELRAAWEPSEVVPVRLVPAVFRPAARKAHKAGNLESNLVPWVAHREFLVEHWEPRVVSPGFSSVGSPVS
jgi:hypothetical protein